MNDNIPQDLKTEIYHTLQDIKYAKNWTEDNQPWLHPSASYARPFTEAALNGQRAGHNGKVRNLSASDLGTVLDCEVQFAASYAGISLVKVRGVYTGKGGTVFHNAVERMLSTDYVTNASETDNRNNGGSRRNRTFVNLPNIGIRTLMENTGKWFNGVSGQLDAYLPKFQTGIELKSVPADRDFPDDVPHKALGQAAGYAFGLRHPASGSRVFYPKYWTWIYLPTDLREFDPTDLSTYRIYFRTYEELEPLFQNILTNARRVASLVDEVGFDAAVPSLTCYAGDQCTTHGISQTGRPA